MALAALDPANVYGAALPWPKRDNARFERAAGAYVLLHNGELVGFLSRGQQQLYTNLSDDVPLQKKQIKSIFEGLNRLLHPLNRTVVHLEKIDGKAATDWVHLGLCRQLGVHVAPSGLMIRLGPAAGLRHA